MAHEAERKDIGWTGDRDRGGVESKAQHRQTLKTKHRQRNKREVRIDDSPKPSFDPV
jgi:hypothetical protein